MPFCSNFEFEVLVLCAVLCRWTFHPSPRLTRTNWNKDDTSQAMSRHRGNESFQVYSEEHDKLLSSRFLVLSLLIIIIHDRTSAVTSCVFRENQSSFSFFVVLFPTQGTIHGCSTTLN